MSAELGLSLFAVGGTVEGHLAIYSQAAPLIGLLGQIAFAAFPFLAAAEKLNWAKSSVLPDA
jgi:hypothetical protein